MRLYGIIGACMAGIPLALLLLFQTCSNVRLKQQILDQKEWEKQGLYLYVWTLNTDRSAGEKVTRAHLEKKKIWVSESDLVDMNMDIHQIIGKKTKTDLKQGYVICAAVPDQSEKHIRTRNKT